jgi:hypothetical protein
VPRLELHDIDDTEAFVGAIVSRSGLDLSYHDREDLQQFLLGECWRLSLVYRRGDPHYGPRFALYATGILRLRVVDWSRKRLGRTRWQFKDKTYERPRAELVSLDADDAGDSGVEPALAGSGLDRGERELADELRLLRERSRPPVGYLEEVRRGLPRRAT